MYRSHPSCQACGSYVGSPPRPNGKKLLCKVLNSLSFTIQRGQKVAFVGESGSGLLGLNAASGGLLEASCSMLELTKPEDTHGRRASQGYGPLKHNMDDECLSSCCVGPTSAVSLDKQLTNHCFCLLYYDPHVDAQS